MLSVLLGVSGCGPNRESVVLYAAQDRVFAEPLCREFEGRTGVEVRAVYDNEATKTTGLANRLRSEASRPLADLWWSNEEMRTRQLVQAGILEPGFRAFGERRRVLVISTNAAALSEVGLSLTALTNAAYRGRIALAYPVFGSTLNHLLVLRQRWGDNAWRGWCRALAANRPLLVDGNSVVVRLVARGDAVLGLTDSDDVAFGRREGMPVRAVPLAGPEALVIPNTVAVVSGAAHPAAARRLAEFLCGPETLAALRAAGALDPEEPALDIEGLTAGEWDRLLTDLDPSVRWIEEIFVRP